MSSFGGRVATGGLLAVIGLITIKLVVALISGFFALMSFLLFTVLPIALVVWLVVKIFRGLSKPSDKPAYE